jgi:hypothetical protein
MDGSTKYFSIRFQVWSWSRSLSILILRTFACLDLLDPWFNLSLFALVPSIDLVPTINGYFYQMASPLSWCNHRVYQHNASAWCAPTLSQTCCAFHQELLVIIFSKPLIFTPTNACDRWCTVHLQKPSNLSCVLSSNLYFGSRYSKSVVGHCICVYNLSVVPKYWCRWKDQASKGHVPSPPLGNRTIERGLVPPEGRRCEYL